MGSVVAQFGEASSDAGSGPAIPAGFLDQWPMIAQVMGGIHSADGQQWLLWPCTISLWFDCGVLKFCLSPKCGPKVCFGSIKRYAEGLDGLEQALTNGDCEWKTRKAQR